MKLTACLLATLALASTLRAEAPATRPATQPTTQPATQPDDGRPGPGHARLKPFVGTFDATIKTRSAPGEAWASTKGTEQNLMILGGRFLQTAWLDRNDGDPAYGITLIGFDPDSNQYTSVSADDSSTSFYIVDGIASPDGKTFTFKEEDGTRTEMKLVKDGYVSHIYDKDDDGKEFMAADISCVRRKS